VLVELKDGSTVAGFFGTRSFASADPEERDIFIEQVYHIDADSTWHPMKNGHGTLIAQGEIRSVDFWPVDNHQKG
jgi:Family of unknown function (DUF6338)